MCYLDLNQARILPRLSGFCPDFVRTCPDFALFGKLGNFARRLPNRLAVPCQKNPFFPSAPPILECGNSLPLSLAAERLFFCPVSSGRGEEVMTRTYTTKIGTRKMDLVPVQELLRDLFKAALTPCPSPRAPCTHGRGRGELFADRYLSPCRLCTHRPSSCHYSFSLFAFQ